MAIMWYSSEDQEPENWDPVPSQFPAEIMISPSPDDSIDVHRISDRERSRRRQIAYCRNILLLRSKRRLRTIRREDLEMTDYFNFDFCLSRLFL